MPAPAQTYASLAAFTEGAARAESGAPPALRLHAQVRRRRAEVSPVAPHEANVNFPYDKAPFLGATH